MNILTVVGNRPQFIKAAGVSHLLRQQYDEFLLHTGQHYDDEMSSVFFAELSLPEPDCYLRVGSGSHARQTAAIMEGLEPVLTDVEPDLVIVYGDTNSTLAGALVAAKQGVPVAHVEAGMRSFDRSMPEEINRVVVDHLSDLLLCPTRSAVEHLHSEGIDRGVFVVGDAMLDVAARVAKLQPTAGAPQRFGLSEPYVLLTAHRAGNVDVDERLEALVEAVEAIPGRVAFPVHPRTRKRLEETGLIDRLRTAPGLVLLPPIGYVDFIGLLTHARTLVTDSGGAQKEAYLFRVPCVTLRDTTEWRETVEAAWNRLVDLDTEALLDALKTDPPAERPALYGGGRAGGAVVGAITTWLEGSGR